MIRFPLLILFFFALTQITEMIPAYCVQASEVIYDNSNSLLGRYAPETVEYGDQIDLEGTARTLTELSYSYYARFQPTGAQVMKVRLYSNEAQYDDYRKSPTTLLYESGLIPVKLGYNSQKLSNLQVPLPQYTVTFTIEFFGFTTDDTAGLLLYSPPAVGFSFNEFWRRSPNGNWEVIRYSTTDVSLKANAALRLVAVPQPVLDQEQPAGTDEVALRDSQKRLRLAQTFTASKSGRLDHIDFQMNWSGAPVRVRILDAIHGGPGTNVLATSVVRSSDTTSQSAAFYDEAFYLEAGRQYAIEFSTDEPVTSAPDYRLRVLKKSAPGGETLWSRDEIGDLWSRASLASASGAELKAVYSVFTVPGEATLRIASPDAGQRFMVGQNVPIRTVVHLPEGKTATRVRFYVNDQQVGEVAGSPFAFNWVPSTPGTYLLRAIAEDELRAIYRSETKAISVYPKVRPANDDFENRIELNGGYVRGSAWTVGGTMQARELRASTNSAGTTLWWSWTAPNDAPVTVSAQNSEGVPFVTVYTGESLETLVLITNGSPSVVFTPVAGQTYSIAVDPRASGERVVLDIASADVTLDAPVASIVKAPAALNLTAHNSGARTITKVQFYANSVLLNETAAAPYKSTAQMNTPGEYDFRVAATDSRGIRTVSAPVRVTVLSEHGTVGSALSVRQNSDGTISVEFDTFSGIPATVEYTTDFKVWKRASDTVASTGNRTEWQDKGPPVTDVHPKDAARRFYRVSYGF